MARDTDLSRYLPAVPEGPAMVTLHTSPPVVPAITSGNLPQYPVPAKPPQVPDFVISGMLLPSGRVRVYASRDVRASVGQVDYRWREPRPDRPRRPDVTLTFRLREFVLVERDTLPECLAEVERIWRTEP